MSWRVKFWVNVIGIYLICLGGVPFAINLFISGIWILGAFFVTPFLVGTFFLCLIWAGKIKPKEKWMIYIGDD